MNFPLILLDITIISGLIALVDVLFWAPKRKSLSNDAYQIPKPLVIDYARSFFPVLLIVLIIRSFIVSPFLVPTGSLEPTVIPGDFLMVNHFAYGLHMPVYGTELIKTGEPKRGDIVVFHWPTNPKMDYIKRVIGLPGDRISYINKVLYINGKEMSQIPQGNHLDSDGNPNFSWGAKEYIENLSGVKHGIYRIPPAEVSENAPPHQVQNFYDLKVPQGYYFMMGDNRDNSEDGRYFGFVPKKYLVGKAERIIFSWDGNASLSQKVRWGRLGTKL